MEVDASVVVWESCGQVSEIWNEGLCLCVRPASEAKLQVESSSGSLMIVEDDDRLLTLTLESFMHVQLRMVHGRTKEASSEPESSHGVELNFEAEAQPE